MQRNISLLLLIFRAQFTKPIKTSHKTVSLFYLKKSTIKNTKNQKTNDLNQKFLKRQKCSFFFSFILHDMNILLTANRSFKLKKWKKISVVFCPSSVKIRLRIFFSIKRPFINFQTFLFQQFCHFYQNGNYVIFSFGMTHKMVLVL